MAGARGKPGSRQSNPQLKTTLDGLRTWQPAFLVFLALLVSCGRYFTPSRDVTEQLSPDDVVGTWCLTQSSIRDLGIGQRGVDHLYAVTFTDDGTCAFDSVIDEISTVKEVSTSECSWELIHDSEIDDAKNILRLRLENHGIWFLRFAKEQGGLHLWQFFGDPDNWEFIEYESCARGPSNAVREHDGSLRRLR